MVWHWLPSKRSSGVMSSMVGHGPDQELELRANGHAAVLGRRPLSDGKLGGDENSVWKWIGFSLTSDLNSWIRIAHTVGGTADRESEGD